MMQGLKKLVADAIGLTARRRAARLAEKLEAEKAKAADMRKDLVPLFDIAVAALLDRNPPGGAPGGDTRGTALYRSQYGVVKSALRGLTFADEAEKPDYCLLWGLSPLSGNVSVASAAAKSGAKLVLCEDGFLRSADTWANLAAEPRYRHGCSVVFDTKGFYFDATRETDVERMLNDPELVVKPEQRAEARRLIDRIVSEKLTKYNHQPLATPQAGRSGRRKVLVVDQSYGDQAIAKGWGSDRIFEEMLEDAKRENPGADILVKTHPDTMTGRRGGYYTGVKEEGDVFRVTMPVNPYSLMELVDKVYVCSTQMGFEALIAGKEVHVYGMPFYAGWGLTVDRQHNPRRTNRRTLEEVFYIFYVLYTHWVDVETGLPCTIDKAMDNLLALREEYRLLRSGRE